MSVADRSLERVQVASLARIPPWISPVVVFVVAAAATFAIILLLAIRQEPSQPRIQRATPNVGLGLHVESQGDRLLISWDRQNPIVAAAAGAVLHIQDGAEDRNIQLDGGQLANGLVSYKPLSNDVNFRLEVQSAQSFVNASLRVLDGTNMVSALPGPVVIRPVLSRASSTETPITISPTEVPPVPAFSDLTPAHERTADQKTAVNTPPPVTSSMVMPPSVEASVSTPPATLPAFLGLDPAAIRVPPMAKPAAAPRVQSVYSPAEPLLRVLPNVDPAWPASISSQAQIQILVRIDERGRVKTAQFLAEAGNANSTLIAAGIVAARGWKFKPAMLDGKPTQSEHVIVFDFRPRQ